MSVGFESEEMRGDAMSEVARGWLLCFAFSGELGPTMRLVGGTEGAGRRSDVGLAVRDGSLVAGDALTADLRLVERAGYSLATTDSDFFDGLGLPPSVDFGDPVRFLGEVGELGASKAARAFSSRVSSHV